METQAVAQTAPDLDPQQRTGPGAGSGERDERASSELWQDVASAGEAAQQHVKEHPIATIAIVAGLAFAVGALWKIGHSRPPSRTEQLLARLSNLSSELPRRWQ